MKLNITPPRRIALALTLISLGIVTIIPILNGKTSLDPAMALAWLSFAGLAWTIALNADSVAYAAKAAEASAAGVAHSAKAAEASAAAVDEMRRARNAEFEPLFDVDIGGQVGGGKHQVRITLRNLGKGAAVGLRVHLYQTDHDDVEWLPERIELPDFMSAGGRGRRTVDVQPEFLRLFSDEDRPVDLLVGLEYRDGLGHEHTELRAFRMVDGEFPARFKRVDTTVDPQRGAKGRLIAEQVSHFAQEHQLEARGMALQAAVDRDKMVFQLTLPDGHHQFSHLLSANIAGVLDRVEAMLPTSKVAQLPPPDSLAALPAAPRPDPAEAE